MSTDICRWGTATGTASSLKIGIVELILTAIGARHPWSAWVTDGDVASTAQTA